MAVNEDISAYSTAAASNAPAGTDTVGPDLDDHLRDIKKNLRLVAETAQGPTAPSAFRGRLWIDTSGTASSKLLLKIHDGSAWATLCEIDDDNERINLTGAGINSLAAPVTVAQGGTNAESTASAITALKIATFGEDSTASAISRYKIDRMGQDSTASALQRLAVPETISGMIELPANKDYVLDRYAGFAYRIDAIYGRMESGSVACRLLIDSATVAMAALTLDTTERTGSPSATHTAAQGSTLILSLTSATAASDLSFSLVTRRL